MEVIDLFKFDHFKVKEAFKHCTADEIKECISKDYLPSVLTLLHHLDNIRCIYGKPIIVNSSYRDFNHNKRVGGVSTSQHLVGSAIDFQPFCKNGACSKSEIINLVKVILQYNETANFIGQLLIYDNFIHIGLLDSSRDSCSYFHIKFMDKKYFSDFYNELHDLNIYELS